MTTAHTSQRERNKAATRQRLLLSAGDLFTRQGYNATTVEQIADAAGVSRRTFFHYFTSKEDVVFGDTDALGRAVLAEFEARPDTESAWRALNRAFRVMADHNEFANRTTMSQLYLESSALRARHLEKHASWQALFAPEVARRMGWTEADDPRQVRSRAVVACSLACLDVALAAWQSDSLTELEVDVDDATAALAAALTRESS